MMQISGYGGGCGNGLKRDRFGERSADTEQRTGGSHFDGILLLYFFDRSQKQKIPLIQKKKCVFGAFKAAA